SSPNINTAFITLHTAQPNANRVSVTAVTDATATADVYSCTMSAGDVTTLAVKGLSAGTINLDLLNSGGSVIATGVSGSTNVDSVINSFAVSTSGTYYARVTGGTNVAYNLAVTRNTPLDTEANAPSATAEPIGGNRGALGAIVPPGYAAAAAAFTFEDISSTGTIITGLDGVDDATASIPIGFTFPFFGNNTTVF